MRDAMLAEPHSAERSGSVPTTAQDEKCRAEINHQVKKILNKSAFCKKKYEPRKASLHTPCMGIYASSFIG